MKLKLNRKWWLIVGIGSIFVIFVIIFFIMKLNNNVNKFGNLGVPTFIKTGDYAWLADDYAKNMIKPLASFNYTLDSKYYRVYKAQKVNLNIDNLAQFLGLKKISDPELSYYVNDSKTIQLVMNPKSRQFNISFAKQNLTVKDLQEMYKYLLEGTGATDLKIFFTELNSFMLSSSKEGDRTIVTGVAIGYQIAEEGLYKALPLSDAFSVAINSSEEYWGFSSKLEGIVCKTEGCPEYDFFKLTEVPQHVEVEDVIFAYAPYKQEQDTFLVPVYIIKGRAFDSYNVNGKKTTITLKGRFVIPAYDFLAFK